ncbi:MAG: ATP-binding protein [Desulfurivibrionaceae bacterium]|jgi:hypothetical protein
MADQPSSLPRNTLRPRARLLRTLGQELISNEVVAVIELVKNAYDADATKVMVRFIPPLELEKGCIEVIDNGHGMTLSTVQSVWMEPATISKREKQRSEKLQRRYLGEKGIGRFASARLAEELDVISRRDGSKEEVFAFFDWRQFDDDERFLDDIEILWEERKPEEICPSGSVRVLWKHDKIAPQAHELVHGTILRMSSLRQTWEAKHFAELTRGLARLISPQKRRTSSSSGDEFEIFLDLPPEFSEFGTHINPPSILKYPHYLVKGSVSGDGTYVINYRVLAEGLEHLMKGRFIRVKNKRGQLEFRNIEEKNDPIPAGIKHIESGPLEFELRVWDRDELGNVVQKTNSTIRNLRRDLDAVAGVNIYRDGFRVLPYGEPQDDWLRLDLRRVQNPTLRLSNNQIHGVVHITADDNPELRDQSNREGLDESQALDDLRHLLTEVLGKLEQLRYAARPRSRQKSGRPVGGLFSGFDFKPLAEHIAQCSPQDKQAKELLEKTEEAFGGQLKEIQTVLARYQRLATLGQLIDHVLHEGRQPIASINNEAYLGLEDIKRLEKTVPDMVRQLTGRFSLISKQGDVLATAFRRMEPFGGRRRGRPAQLYLEEIIRDAFAVFRDDLDRLKLKTILPRTQTLVRVDPAEIQEVIINLLQNSLYWLEQVDESRREIVVKVERKGSDHLDIIFSDSGPGIPQGNRDLIFDPYFSTKAEEGIGLGLSIVGEIVSDYYGGVLELLDHGPLPGANFLITLRKRV